MTSVLKRKRAQAEITGTPKKAKSANYQSNKSAPENIKIAGWDAAFNRLTSEDIIPTNRVHENGTPKVGEVTPPEAVEFEDFLKEEADHRRSLEFNQLNFGQPQTASHGAIKSNGKSSATKTKKKKLPDKWKISEPIGGRLINADPVFTLDEKHLIVSSRTTIQVYSTSNSLLTRAIKLNITTQSITPPRIVAFSLSPSEANILWVACSDANIFRIDWITGLGADSSWGVISAGCLGMTVASMESAGRRRDIVFLTELRKDGGFRVTANELAIQGSGFKNAARTIYTSTERINQIKTGRDGTVIVGSCGKKVMLGQLRSTAFDTIDNIRYEFRVFESIDTVKSLDMRISNRSATDAEGLKKSVKKLPIVDVVVGDIKGVVFVHNDILLKVFADVATQSSVSLIPRKMHWHRQAVHTVKWSLDGNYVISGGAETVLVLWQLDTGKQQYLPHMSATIQNVVVSHNGASYAVQLSDNSAMVLSTAELQPTANVSGIQIPVIEAHASLESELRRIADTTWDTPLVQRTPAVINPARPSQLLLGVGQVQEIVAIKPQKMSNPFLASFDFIAGSNISRQALARTNITNVDAAASAYRMTEPRVTHIKISRDGLWLATVDEWMPPKEEMEHLKGANIPLIEEQQHRREVFLKFWQWNPRLSTWELVSRINAPHTLSDLGDAGRILDVAVDPSSLRFSTIGEDGIVRTWIPRTRKRDGIVVRDEDKRPLKNWSCQQAIILGKLDLYDPASDNHVLPRTGLIAFSEDGSLLAAAISNEDGLLHLIDPNSGTIRISHTGLFKNEIFGLGILGQDLIIISRDLIVFDLVSQELRYGIRLFLKNHDTVDDPISIEQSQEMIHLAINERSQTFAIALPNFTGPKSNTPRPNLWHVTSTLIVFSTDSPEPQIKKTFSSIISALIPTPDTDGFLVLDTCAEVHTVLKNGTYSLKDLATSSLQLDMVPEEAVAGDLTVVENEDAEKEEEDEDELTAEKMKSEDVDTNIVEQSDMKVVTSHQLSQIFDIGPAFALPPMEEMFYRVAGLFTAKEESK